MKNNLAPSSSGAPAPLIKSTFNVVLLLTMLLLLGLIQPTQAGSATWNLNPISGDWNTAANWTPATVPDGAADTATFDLSNMTAVSVMQNTEVNSIVFNSGASPYTITVSPNTSDATLTISGNGIINNSGIKQNFVTDLNPQTGRTGFIDFTGSATAGDLTVFTNKTEIGSGGNPVTRFHDSSTAGNAIFINEGGLDQDLVQAGGTVFLDTSTAATGTFICHSGTGTGFPGFVVFVDKSTADRATFLLEDAMSGSSAGGNVQFQETATAGNGVFQIGAKAAVVFFASSTAANATLIANAGTEAGGWIVFEDISDGGTARVKLLGNARLLMTYHTSPSVTIGSLEGEGRVLLSSHLGAKNLTVGSNNRSTTFSGNISGTEGSLTKIGTGKLVLDHASSYTGGTTVESGVLVVSATRDSATGTGPVQVNGGTLAGTGTVSGAVTVGSGSGPGASLAPGVKGPGTLTIANALTFQSDGSYNCDLGFTPHPKADTVSASGVTLQSGAKFALRTKGTQTLAAGTSFTVIDNTAASAISGTFSNLADGSTLTVGSNTFLVSYEGGTGNDLTLTVVL